MNDLTQSLNSIGGIEALRCQREVNEILGILTGEITTKNRLGGYGPEDLLRKYLFEVTDIFPRSRLLEMRRGKMVVLIWYDDSGENFQVEFTRRRPGM